MLAEVYRVQFIGLNDRNVNVLSSIVGTFRYSRVGFLGSGVLMGPPDPRRTRARRSRPVPRLPLDLSRLSPFESRDRKLDLSLRTLSRRILYKTSCCIPLIAQGIHLAPLT